MKQEIQKQKWQLDAMEQYIRRYNIKIVGYPEPATSVTEDTAQMIVNTCQRIRADFRRKYLRVCHRLPGQAKAIVAKFVRRYTKVDIMKLKKKMKDASGSKIIIYEDLTSLFSKLLRA